MQFRIERWITGPVAGVSLLLLIVAISGAWYVRRMQTESSEILTRSVASMRAAEELEFLLLKVRHHVDRYLWQGNEGDLEAIAAQRQQIEHWISRAEESKLGRERHQHVDAIRMGLEVFYSRLSELQQDRATDHREEAEVLDALLAERVLPHANDYLTTNELELESSSRKNEILSDRLVMWLLLLGVLGASSGVAAGWAMERIIHRSIYQLQLPIHALAGKLNEVVGPISIPANSDLEELELVLGKVSQEVEAVVEKLHASHQQVMRADQLAALGQLAAGMAHEIRNPLMCMKIVVQSAIARKDATLERRDLDVLDEEIRRLEGLLTEFLDFARPGELSKSRVDLRTIVEATVSFVRSKAERRGIRLELQDENQPVQLIADAARIRQLLLNLLLNSLDAVKSGGEVLVELREIEDSRGRRFVELSVEDDGEGISEANREKVFEPFFSTRETGLGLGLPICRRIVESHDGRIVVRSRPEGGTRITVTLPHNMETEFSPGKGMIVQSPSRVGIQE